MKTVLSLFFIREMGFDETDATAAVSLFMVACYITPIFGAWLSDAHIGRYSTILLLSMVHLVGNAMLAGW